MRCRLCTKSIPAVKADAATAVFKVDCSEIGWAVLDSGIDGKHPAFGGAVGGAQRVKRSFDFRNFRKIVSLSNVKPGIRKRNREILMKDKDRLLQAPEDPDGDLTRLAEDASNRGPIHWELVERFVEIKPRHTAQYQSRHARRRDHRRQQEGSHGTTPS